MHGHLNVKLLHKALSITFPPDPYEHSALHHFVAF